MYYCENCKLLSDSNICPLCESKNLRNAKDEDLCFLTEKGTVYSGVLKGALINESIPYSAHSVLSSCSAGNPGPIFETHRFFVPYAFLSRAKEIEENAYRT